MNATNQAPESRHEKPGSFRRAKILATLGPASNSFEMINTLVKTGVDVFRLNFSHGSHEDHKRNLNFIRMVEEETGRPIGIVADLQGPKLRLGVFKGDKATINEGDGFTLYLKEREGDATGVSMPHKEIFDAVESGDDILINDGKLRLKAVSNDGEKIETTVMVGGEISNRKGVNLPGTILPVSPLTEKDRADLEFALSLGINWVALSFVQRPQDVVEAKELIKGKAGIISKIEKPSAVKAIKEIVAESDAVMVARGDLGVEMLPEEVPAIQKEIVAECRAKGRPVIVATQMLESMIESPVATRAEVSDVATAIYDGADAVMLSAETAAGNYPQEAVQVMANVIRLTEGDWRYDKIVHADETVVAADDSDAIAHAASTIAGNVGCKAVCTFTKSGSTALRVSRMRGSVPILGLTPSLRVARRMTLFWGVYSIQTRDDADYFEDMVGKSERYSRRIGVAMPGDRVVVTAGVPFGYSGTTNVLRIAVVSDDELTEQTTLPDV